MRADMWMLGTELESSGRTAHAPNHSPVTECYRTRVEEGYVWSMCLFWQSGKGEHILSQAFPTPCCHLPSVLNRTMKECTREIHISANSFPVCKIRIALLVLPDPKADMRLTFQHPFLSLSFFFLTVCPNLDCEG